LSGSLLVAWAGSNFSNISFCASGFMLATSGRLARDHDTTSTDLS
jgi:hypothetical protein